MNLTQEQFAIKVDMNRGNIASYEKGSAEPSIEKLQRIVEYFKTDLNHFIHKNIEESTSTARKDEFTYRYSSDPSYLNNSDTNSDMDIEFRDILRKYSEINEYKFSSYKKMDHSLESIHQELNELKMIMKDILKINSQILAHRSVKE